MLSSKSDFQLTATTPLTGFAKTFDDVTVREIIGKALVSIATPNGGEKALSGAMAKAFKAKLPAIGSSTFSDDGKMLFWGMQIDQMFVLFDFEEDDAVSHVAKKLGNAAYYSDQSDSWVMVSVSGAQSRAALARICALDLHEEAFAKGAVARTAMEHLGTIIYRSGRDDFMVLSARSSAQSLLHAIETSAFNIMRPKV